MTKGLVLAGFGAHGRETLWRLRTSGIAVRGFLDDRPPPVRDGQPPCLGGTGDWLAHGSHDFLAVVADPRVRRRMIASMEASGQPRFARFLDPTAIIADDAELGEGVSILAQALISTRARLGLHVIVNRAVQISHDCEIGDFVTLAPQASLSGGVRVGAGAEIGAGALVRQGVTIGEGALVGMGAVVVKDVPPASVVVGNPARLLRTLDPFPVSPSRQSEAP